MPIPELHQRNLRTKSRFYRLKIKSLPFLFKFTIFAFFQEYAMNLKIKPKEIIDAYSTPIVQQTSFWSKVKERLGMNSCAFEFAVRNNDK